LTGWKRSATNNIGAEQDKTQRIQKSKDADLEILGRMDENSTAFRACDAGLVEGQEKTGNFQKMRKVETEIKGIL
jgi:hypothetical protein